MKPMSNLIQEIWEFTENKKGYFAYYQHNTYPEGQDILKNFLFATMDEVRLRNAATYSRGILKITDIDDLDHFRVGLLRRETVGDISYPKQRDHSAHTLYNFLLGWYFYEACPSLRVSLNDHFGKRNEVKEQIYRFGDIWPFVSVAHDLGYLLEGSLSPLSTKTQDDLVSIGASVIQEYFRHTFWIANHFDSTAERDLLLKLCQTDHLDISARTLTGIADSLRNLGNLDALRKCIKQEREIEKIPPPPNDFISEENGLSGDAFDLWEANYLYYGNTQMAERMRKMRKVFSYLLQHGLDGSGLRLLDHGICSGLILLLYSTYFFRIYFGLKDDQPSDKNERNVWEKFRKGTSAHSIGYQALWWWSHLIRGTACTAIHNIQQMEPVFLNTFGLGKIELNEEPLAYLGILVDIIQEWDRTTVRKESIIGGRLPLQGIDCKLRIDSGKVILAIPNSNIKNGIVKALDECLVDWMGLLAIE